LDQLNEGAQQKLHVKLERASRLVERRVCRLVVVSGVGWRRSGRVDVAIGGVVVVRLQVGQGVWMMDVIVCEVGLRRWGRMKESVDARSCGIWLGVWPGKRVRFWI
jgi:hypothetical protein